MTLNANILYRSANGTSPQAKNLTLVFPLDCEGDLDGDGLVNINDLLIVLSDYGCIGDGCEGDSDNSGVVGIEDILNVLAAFGDSCY